MERARQRPLGGVVHGRPHRPVALRGARLGRPPAPPGASSSSAASIPTTCRRAAHTGAELIARRAASAAGRGPRSGSADWARALRAATRRRATCKRIALDETLFALARRHAARAGVSRSRPSCAVVVERERARFSTWYELFPRSRSRDARRARHASRTCDERLDRHRGDGLRRALPAAHPSRSGATKRKGSNNARSAAAGRRRQPVGDRRAPRAATRRSIPQLGTLADFRTLLDAARSARHRDRARHRLPVRARPSVRRRAPRVVPARARRHASSTPRTRRRSTRTSTRSTSRAPRLARAVAGAAVASSRSGSAQGVRIFRVDNPHTKPFAFWEWLIGEVKRAPPARDLPLRGVHAPARHAPAGQARLLAVVHLLHLAQDQARSSPSTSPSSRRARRATTSAPTAGPTRPTSFPTTCSTRRSPMFRLRYVLAATLAANYGMYGPAFELGENRAARRRQRGIPRLREVRDQGTGTSSSATALRAAHRAA